MSLDPKPRTLALLLLVPALHAIAREVDGALGLVVGSGLEEPFLWQSLGGILAGRLGAIAASVALLVASAAGLAAFLAWKSSCRAGSDADGTGRSRARRWRDALNREGVTFAPLLIRPALTLLALGSVALRPTYPYAFTLPVGLTQDLGIAQDVLALVTMLALRVPRIEIPAPRPGAVFFVTTLVYGATVPDWALRWEGHPGNEPKYLRQAVALGHELSFDAEGVSGPMEQLSVAPLGQSLSRAARVVLGETARMVAAGPSAFDRESIRSTRITRQTITGKEGGVYYVLAPGPSLLLAPTLRVDRAINLLRGVEGRVAVSVLLSVLLGAALVTVLFVLARDVTARPGLAAAIAFFFALTPPFVFFSYQFYPEMHGALAMALLFRSLSFGGPWKGWSGFGLGLVLAFLPWLHQKFLPVFGILVLTGAFVAWRDRWGRSGLVALFVPAIVSAALTLLYNFAVTGCARPDALFLAWGPGGVTSARLGQGTLGLLLDVRYGIVPYAPVYALALAGLVVGGPALKRLLILLPATLVYYATVAAADNWAGAVCNLGRYMMPVAPVLVVLVALAVHRVSSRRGAVVLVLALAAWTGILSLALRADPVAANDSWLLLAKSEYVDGTVYIPHLHLRHWSQAAPGLVARIIAFGVGASLLAWALSRAARGRMASPLVAALGLVTFLLGAGFILELWPARRTAPAPQRTLSVGHGVVLRILGPALVRDDRVELPRGETEVLVRRPSEVSEVTLLVGGEGRVELPGMAPFVLRPQGAFVRLPLSGGEEVRGGDGGALFTRLTIGVENGLVLRPAPDFREHPATGIRSGI